MTALAHLVGSIVASIIGSLAGGSSQGHASEALPSPTVFVVVYVALWLLLVGLIAWLATTQHRLDTETQKIQHQLQTRLDRDDSHSTDQGGSL